MRRGTCAMSPWEGDVHSDEGRTRRSRDRAAQAYAFLLDAAGDHWRDMVLIGGLVPDTLVDTEEPHQGTLDVDVLLPLALQYDRDDEDFAWLESALVDAGFVRTHENTGWRWVNDVDGYPVIVEFLVDVPDAQGQEIPLPGADRLGAMNVAGPGPALHDARVVQFAGREAKVAGIGGYLAAKAAAIVGRGRGKDLYDFAYVLVNSGRTVRELAEAVAAATEPSPLWSRDPRHDVRAALRACSGADSVGARTYAAEAVSAGSEEPFHDLASDAAAAAASFSAALEARFPPA